MALFVAVRNPQRDTMKDERGVSVACKRDRVRVGG